MLYRMVVHVRGEAVRPRATDVALLLEHAEGAVTAFASASPNSHGPAPSIPDADCVEH